MDKTNLYIRSLNYFLDPLREVLSDPGVTEVLVNGRDAAGQQAVYVERKGELQRSPLRFPDEAWIASLAQNLGEFVGRRLDETHHSLSGRLPADSLAGPARVHIVAPPASRSGYCISIRKFKRERQSLEKLVDGGSLTAEAAELMQMAVRMKKNIAVSGGTGTGKTTLLNALTEAIPGDERIIVIEDTSELDLPQPHCVYLESRQGHPTRGGGVSIRDLFVDSLRMRPDRIIVGEVRRGEALDMIQTMLSGHAGALTTVHANSPLDAVARLETLCLMTEEPLPHDVARLQVGSAIDLIVQIERVKGVRRVASIEECLGTDDTGRYQIRPTYATRYMRSEGRVVARLRRVARPRFARGCRAHFEPTEFPRLKWLFASPAANAVGREITGKQLGCRDRAESGPQSIK